jgi:hypothetical protein
VVPLPWPFAAPDEVLPDSLPGELAVYCGPIPQRPEHYSDLEVTLGKRGARLVNTAVASEQATRIEHWHERLGELTARTVILRGPADLPAAAALGFPVFVKGLVKSAKELGLDACLAHDHDRLEDRARAAWRHGQTVVAREYLPLRYTGETVMEFPHGREYRFILLDREVLGSAFYWDGIDPFASRMGGDDPPASLAVSAADRLDARLLAVDIGQLQDGSWRVIRWATPSTLRSSTSRRTCTGPSSVTISADRRVTASAARAAARLPDPVSVPPWACGQAQLAASAGIRPSFLYTRRSRSSNHVRSTRKSVLVQASREVRALARAQAAERLAERNPAALQDLGGLHAPYLGEGQKHVEDLRGLQVRGRVEQQRTDRLPAGLEVALELRTQCANLVRPAQGVHPLIPAALGGRPMFIERAFGG